MFSCHIMTKHIYQKGLLLIMRLNKGDQVYIKLAYDKGLNLSAKDMKRTKEFSEIDGVISELALKNKTTVRETFEYEIYPDIRKLRVKSFQNLILLLIYLKEILKQMYPKKEGHILMNKLRDLNPMDIIKKTNILEELGISERTFYDYINTLQMILDYSNY